MISMSEEIKYECCKNALQPFAEKINEEVARAVEFAKSLSPKAVFMTGSGSTCFSMYNEFELASWAFNKLKKQYGDRVELLYAIDPKNLSFFDNLF